GELGLHRGDRVGIYLEKRIEMVVTMFAASITGSVFVPINHVLKTPQVEHILRDSGARVLVTSTDRLRGLRDTLEDSAVVHVIAVGDGDADAGGVAAHPWPQSRQNEPAQSNAVDLDPAAILYTSGSTG